jgi:hypothetical protein
MGNSAMGNLYGAVCSCTSRSLLRPEWLWIIHLCRSSVIAAAEDHIAIKCFEVVGDYVLLCFANGKLEIYDKSTQALVRKPIAAHGAEIKSIIRSTYSIVYTACVDNQVRRPRNRGCVVATPVAQLVVLQREALDPRLANSFHLRM